MLLLFRFAFAGEPSPPPPPPVVPACVEGQRCGDRCIPWTDVCPATLTHALDTVDAEKKNDDLASALCVPLPDVNAPKAMSPEGQILLSTVAGTLCGAEQRTNPEACANQAVDQTARPDTPPPVPCRPGVAPAPASAKK